jgi:TnpA family transposase
VQTWLTDNIALQQDDLSVLVGAAAERFRSRQIEIPPLDALSALSQQALDVANAAIEQRLGRLIDEQTARQVLAPQPDSALSWLEALKEPAPPATPNTLEAELRQLERLAACAPDKVLLAEVRHSKVARLATIAARYNAAELGQLRPMRRYAIITSFLVVRRAEQLDRLAEMFVRLWQGTKAAANRHADAARKTSTDIDEAHRMLLDALLDVILTSDDADTLWQAVHDYKKLEEYAAAKNELKKLPKRIDLYHSKLLDHYSAMRRFLPRWYERMPLIATTTDSSLLKAKAMLRSLGEHSAAELPSAETPTSFLSPPWDKRAVCRYRKSRKIIKINKAPYELGCCEATAEALTAGTVAVCGANRYAAMTDHLLDRERFLRDFDKHRRDLGLPARACDYYGADRDTLDERIDNFDAAYEQTKKQFWVNREGKLGFSRASKPKPSAKVDRLQKLLIGYMPAVSILDVLLDCHRWTGFVDIFQPCGGRQNMRDTEKLLHVLATIYCYGCNCGPSQAAQAVGLDKNQLIYMRRHYMQTKHLIEVAAVLREAYERTAVAKRLGEPGIIMTDAMHLRTLRQSLAARQYYRDVSNPSVLLYQHVTADCVCKFTQALLVNLSEGLHMLHGVLLCRDGQGHVVNICDSGGKSNLVFGLARPLHIELNPRPRSRNMKLWAACDKRSYEHIAGAIAGTVDWQKIDAGWLDMVWILASIAAGTAPPALIFERLAATAKHPATLGFEELGKLDRSNYLLRYGMDMELRRFVIAHTAKREHWNGFTRDVLAFGDLIREKSREGQEEIFWFLTVLQNAIVLWNALAIDKAVEAARRDGHSITDEDLQHVLPTIVEHINFVGRFMVNLRRRPPFRFAA